MTKKSLDRKRIIANIKGHFSITLMILFSIIVIFSDINTSQSSSNTAISMINGWIDEDGKKRNLNSLPQGNITLTKDISQIATKELSLCTISMDTLFDVYADGVLIYSYKPKIPRILGKSYGMYVHTIAIPLNTNEIKLSLEPIFNDPAKLTDTKLEVGSKYISGIFKRNMLPFLCSVITLIVGVIFHAIGISKGLVSRSVEIDFVSFGAFCFLLGFFGMNDTYFLQIITQHSAIIRVLTYISLMFIPYPAFEFFTNASRCENPKLKNIMLLICTANFLISAISTYIGISDYFYLVRVSHFSLLLTSVLLVIIIGSAFKNKKVRPNLINSIGLGLSTCVIGAIMDIVRYYIKREDEFFGFSRIGVFIFMLFVSIYLFNEHNDALKRKHNENTIFIQEITEAFAKVIDMKDSYTNGHSIRVAKYTEMLTRELGYEEEIVQKYYRIALLHDIGKIGVPTEVLNKPGKLTDEEYNIIKSHTTKGYEVLKNISIMPELAIGAESHHERPDGKGYPNALKGKDIPRVAQIIAVADCFDAMYSDRPYRKRMNFDKAVSIIKEVSGTQLTKDVVDAFMRLVERGEFREIDDFGGGTTENIDNIQKKSYT